MANTNPPKVVNVLELAPLLTPDGGFFSDGGNVFTDGQGNLVVNGLAMGMSSGGPTGSITGGTITFPAGTWVIRENPAGAITGVIMQAGPANRNVFAVIVNISPAANTITFAAVNTSLVAGGASVSLAGLAAHLLFCDSV